ncbi:hypothetical protein P153DRAFT_389581 [Dothidotthia symphoricarpi CBS 119687]|uniref:Uncharacterized protein n=1 Tax=Dothidotthia symphoricarpi CBS 119687 TaxID=1392245 RepID=A0A6A6A2K2_9PLEO|nr:uncharacterized protein P153DRAFT_389581 [Dothidotthia symphoricarpi CBS 119687]KAF2125425.1 hypothetical protein P153DRAFT_389581 [Dothidotthia symphoricarpi CBS 119687]
MASAAVSQLQQWTFEKPTVRSSTLNSVSSAKLDDASDTLRIDTTAVEKPSAICKKENICLQERYMSSEEGLSPADMASDSESEYDYDDVVIHDITRECQKARTLSVSRWNKGQSCDMAVRVSYAFAGRPKVIELATVAPPCPPVQQRAVSVAHLPVTAISKLRKADQAQRMSLTVTTTNTRPLSPPASRSVSPSINFDTRRPSTSHSPLTKKLSTLELSSSASTTSTIQTGNSSRSVTPVNDASFRPGSATAESSSSGRSSVYVPSISRSDLHRIQTSQAQFRQSHIAPLTPVSPASHAFLNTDPFGNQSADNVAKPAPHRRLRSISMKLALARIAISPSSRKHSAQINGQAPPTPSSPFTPLTPQTAPLEGMSSYFPGPVPNKLRRASTILRPKSRHAESVRGPSPEMPPIPSFTSNSSFNRQSRMVARGANERAPTLEIPSFDDLEDPMASIKAKRLRKRKSLMSLM